MKGLLIVSVCFSVLILLPGAGPVRATPSEPDSVQFTGQATSDGTMAGLSRGFDALGGKSIGNRQIARPRVLASQVGDSLPFAAATFTETSRLSLAPGEDGLLPAVIDTANGFAYFGANSLGQPKRLVKVRLSDFSRVGALIFSPTDSYITSAVIDTTHGFAYFSTHCLRYPSTCEQGGVVHTSLVKVRLSDFAVAGILDLDIGWREVASALVDPDGGYAYFGTVCEAYKTSCSDPGTVIKVHLSDFTVAATLSFSTNEEIGAWPAVMDTVHGFAYFGTYCLSPCNHPNSVVKVRLSDFTQVDTLVLNIDDNRLYSAVIDADSEYVYFGTVIYTCMTCPAQVVKVRLSDFTNAGVLPLSAGESGLMSAIIDSANGFAYFGTSTGLGTDPGIVVKVRLSDFTRVGAIVLSSRDVFSAVLDPVNGYAYFGTYSYPGTIVKVRVGFDNLVLTPAADVSANAGDVLTYTLTVNNDSPVDATALTLTDTLPVSVTFNSVTPGPATCNAVGGEVVCNLGTLSDGASTQVIIQTAVDASIVRGVIINTASVSATEPRFSTPKIATVTTLINPLHLYIPAVQQ